MRRLVAQRCVWKRHLIDLHCHLLPGIDDGATTVETSIAMARLAVADGIDCIVCTPHIMPGVYDNDGAAIAAGVASLARRLNAEGISLQLMAGADVHIAPAMLQGLRDGKIPSLNASRFLLFEPPHHVVPPQMEDLVFSLMVAGYVPILTHPERLSWIESHYSTILRLANMGVLLQLTASSLTGGFGRRPRYWAERILDEGWASVVASDAHNVKSRPPVLSEARELVARRLGAAEALSMVLERPKAILADRQPSTPLAGQMVLTPPRRSIWSRLGLS